MEPHELFDLSRNEFKQQLAFTDLQIDRIERLVTRSASLAFKIEKLSRIGIHIVTRASSNYPIMLKRVLGHACSPLFYYVGDISLI